MMRFIDILGLGLSILGAHSVLRYFRYLLPRNLISLVLLRLNETEAILDSAEAIGAILSASEYRISFAMYEGRVCGHWSS